MHLVKHLLREKSGPVYIVAPAATVLDASRVMNRQKIGSLVVMEGPVPIGIITERDIMTRVVAEERAPASTPVRAVMTPHLITCSTSTPLDDVRRVMRERRIRHVPVIEDGALVGMVSIGDLNKAETEALSQTVSYLEAYITH